MDTNDKNAVSAKYVYVTVKGKRVSKMITRPNIFNI